MERQSLILMVCGYTMQVYEEFYLQSFNQKRATCFKACENLRRIGGVEKYVRPSCGMIMYTPIKWLKGTHWKFNREFGHSIARCVQGYWYPFVWELSYDMHTYILDTFIIQVAISKIPKLLPTNITHFSVVIWGNDMSCISKGCIWIMEE